MAEHSYSTRMWLYGLRHPIRMSLYRTALAFVSCLSAFRTLITAVVLAVCACGLSLYRWLPGGPTRQKAMEKYGHLLEPEAK